MKVYVLKLGLDIFYLEEIEYQNYEERYEKTKGINPMYIFEDEDEAIDRLVELNSI